MSDYFETSQPSRINRVQRSWRRKTQKFATYFGLVASTIQKSPDKMLTFSQLMDRMEEFITGERKRFENTVRVCLSTYDCFIKIPTNPHNRLCKKNYWKVDEDRITMKMVRRHIDKADLDIFPLLSSKIRMEPTTTSVNSELSVAKTVDRCEVKFSSSFSIESILKRDSSRAGLKPPRLSVLSSPTGGLEQQPWRAERGITIKRRLDWDATTPVGGHPAHYPNRSYHNYSSDGATGHAQIFDGSRPVKRLRQIHFRSTQNQALGILYPLPTTLMYPLSHVNQYFRL